MTIPVFDHRRPKPALYEPVLWTCEFRVEKFHGDDLTRDPYEVHLADNMLMAGGASLLWEALIGNAGSGALAFLTAANAAIGVGNSNAAEDHTHTDLQATSSKLRKGMNSSFPAHTDGTTAAAKSVQFQSTFSTGEANWDWNELAIFNSATAGAGRMLNRKVAAWGTKTNMSAWQVTATLLAQ